MRERSELNGWPTKPVTHFQFTETLRLNRPLILNHGCYTQKQVSVKDHLQGRKIRYGPVKYQGSGRDPGSFTFLGHSHLWPQNFKKDRYVSKKHIVDSLHQILGPYFFLGGSVPGFSYRVNRLLVTYTYCRRAKTKVRMTGMGTRTSKTNKSQSPCIGQLRHWWPRHSRF